MILAARVHSPCLEFLIKHNADVNIQDNCGNTALMNAVIKGNIECVESLLLKKLDLNIQNNDGKTAYDLAEDSDAIRVLLDNHRQ